ncbi:hypothetical protein [Geomicrobium sp. JCM 19039]|uniref:hypothetical protein n=1 Tax=Geomicrobium sp. JCM 19039 TaxID=1460636 RepID=UPI00045F19A7|nr:hypothetical protein [Geomicrobium sp. JCM 19039]GAK13041.1 hypothetical protein JCM19039_2856 [Geomicrobium sp. JCM 19039]
MNKRIISSMILLSVLAACNGEAPEDDLETMEPEVNAHIGGDDVLNVNAEGTEGIGGDANDHDKNQMI